MAQVISPHIWYPEGYPGSAYDLRDISMWWFDDSDAQLMVIRFLGTNTAATKKFNAADFEVAKQASLDAGG